MGGWQFPHSGRWSKVLIDWHSRPIGRLGLRLWAQALGFSLVSLSTATLAAPRSPQASVVSPAIQTAILNPQVVGAPRLPDDQSPAKILSLEPTSQEPVSGSAELSLQNNSAQDLQPSPLVLPDLGRLPPSGVAQTPPVESAQSPVPANSPPPTSPTPDSTTRLELDPELGNLRLEELELQPPPPKSLYLLGGINYFNSNNIFASIDPVDDSLMRTGLALLYTPALGPDTYLVASVQGNIVRYFNQSSFSYNELLFETGVYQQLSPAMYGQIGWTNQQLFTVETGERFLGENALRLTLGRSDRLTDRLTLESFYQFRWGFAEPSVRDRVVNYLGVGLTYLLQPNTQVALEYQLALTSFNQLNRSDTYNQIVARLSYQWTPEVRLNVIGGYSFGSSSDPFIKFDGSILGVTLDWNVSLF